METINDSNYELWLLRYAEQELTPEERKVVEAWLTEHPEAAEELALYNEAPRLSGDESVRYGAAVPNGALPLWPAVLRWCAAAAVVAALMVPVLRIDDGNVMEQAHEGLVAAAQPSVTETTVPDTTVAMPTKARCIKPVVEVRYPEEQVLAEAVEPEEPTAVAEPIAVPVQDEVADAPEVIYTDNLIVYELAPDTVYTNNLIVYDDSRRSWTEDVKDWATETKMAQWVRRRFKVREAELLAMNE